MLHSHRLGGCVLALQLLRRMPRSPLAAEHQCEYHPTRASIPLKGLQEGDRVLICRSLRNRKKDCLQIPVIWLSWRITMQD